MIRSRRRGGLAAGTLALAACGTGGSEDTFMDPTTTPTTITAPDTVTGATDVVGSEPAGGVDPDESPARSEPATPDSDLNSAPTGPVVEYVDADRNAAASTVDADLTAEQVDSVVIAYEEFLVGADAVWLQGREGDPELVAEGLVDFQLSRHERTSDSELDALETVRSHPNIERISGSVDAGVVIEDCLETSTTNPLFIVSSDFVRQTVTLESLGADWLVRSVEILHDGQRESVDELGCVPAIYAERAEEVTIEFLRLEGELHAQPTVELPAVHDVTTPEFRRAVESEATATGGQTPPGIDDVVVDTIGHSALAGTRTLFVGVCQPATAEDTASVISRVYEVTRGLAAGFPDTGDGRDVYAVAGRSSPEQVDVCHVGSDS